MANIEQQNIEKNIWWSAESKVNIYKDELKWKEFGKIQTEEDRKKAEELLTEIQSPWEEDKKIVKNTSEIRPEIKNTIKDLNRPEAEKWLEQAYTNMEKTIKNSKNEKWIAGFLGKIMNKILG